MSYFVGRKQNTLPKFVSNGKDYSHINLLVNTNWDMSFT